MAVRLATPHPAIAVPNQARGRMLLSASFVAMLIFALLPSSPWVHALNARFGHVFQPYAIFTLVWIVVVRASGGKAAARDGFALVLAFLIVYAGLLSAFWYGGSSWVILGQTIVLPVIAFWGILSVDRSELPRLGQCLNLVLLLATATQLLEYLHLTGNAGLSPGFVSANHYNVALHTAFGQYSFGNSDNASSIYVAALAVGLVVGRTAPSAPKRLLGHVAALTALGAVFIGGSRGALIGCLFAIVIARWPRSSSGHRTQQFTFILVVLLVAGGVWALLKQQPLQAQSGSVLGREQAANLGAHLVLSHPLFAAGLANVNTAVLSAAQTSSYSLFAGAGGGTAYNVFINWGVSAGLASMVAAIILTVGAVMRSVRARIVWGSAPLLAFLFVGFTVGAEIIGTGTYEWALLFWVILGLAWRADWASPKIDLV